MCPRPNSPDDGENIGGEPIRFGDLRLTPERGGTAGVSGIAELGAANLTAATADRVN